MARHSEPMRPEIDGEAMAQIAFRFVVVGTLLFGAIVIGLHMLMH